MSEFVYYPNLPLIPQHLLDNIDQCLETPGLKTAVDRICIKDGLPIPTHHYERHPVPENLVDWVRNNIADDFVDVGLASYGGAGQIGLPHIDRTRDWTLIYFLDLGGSDVDTIFWQQQGHDVFRPVETVIYSYDDLVELEKHRFQLNRWVLLNARCLHSMSEFSRPRKSIQVGFWNDSLGVRRLIESHQKNNVAKINP